MILDLLVYAILAGLVGGIGFACWLSRHMDIEVGKGTIQWHDNHGVLEMRK